MHGHTLTPAGRPLRGFAGALSAAAIQRLATPEMSWTIGPVYASYNHKAQRYADVREVVLVCMPAPSSQT